MLPKYFKNLTLAISSITGMPKICSLSGLLLTDKYKDIPEENWLDCIMLYFHQQQLKNKNQPKVHVAGCSSNNKMYYTTGGSFKNKAELLLHIVTIKEELIKKFETWEQMHK